MHPQSSGFSVAEGNIQKYSDADLLALLYPLYGKNSITMFLFYLNNSCSLFGGSFYGKYYAELEKKTSLPETEFVAELSQRDSGVGYDNNLGEIKTYVLQQVLQNIKNIQLYVFCSDDKRAGPDYPVQAEFPVSAPSHPSMF